MAAGPESVPASTATRLWAYRYGTLDAEWQCTARCPVRSPTSGSVSCTATCLWAYRTHCHSPLIVPMRYARCRVAVRAALPSTLTTEWQCESHCHSPPNVPVALPLDPERTVSYVHHRVAVYGVPPSTLDAEWQCTVRRQERVINVLQAFVDLLGGHPGLGAGNLA